MRGKFSERLGLWRWRDQTGGRLGNPQHHGVAVGDEDIAHTVGARASRDQRKTTPEEWMPRVCDFHFSQVVYQWVVDRGMKLFDPSTTSTMTAAGDAPVEDRGSSMLRLIKKWLKAGVLDTDGQGLHPVTGLPQGGIGVTDPGA